MRIATLAALITGKYDGASAKLERINPRRRRCLIEPPADLEGIIVHVRKCWRYRTGAIVPGTRTRGTRDLLYSRAIHSFDPSPLGPTASPLFPSGRLCLVWERNSPRRTPDYRTVRFLAA